MTLFAVIFEDDLTKAADIRHRHISAHLDFLQASGCFIRAAGPLRQAGDILGGLWIVEAKNLEEIDRLIAEDPFCTAGLRRSVRVLVWDQVFVDGVCLARP